MAGLLSLGEYRNLGFTSCFAAGRCCFDRGCCFAAGGLVWILGGITACPLLAGLLSLGVTPGTCFGFLPILVWIAALGGGGGLYCGGDSLQYACGGSGAPSGGLGFPDVFSAALENASDCCAFACSSCSTKTQSESGESPCLGKSHCTTTGLSCSLRTTGSSCSLRSFSLFSSGSPLSFSFSSLSSESSLCGLASLVVSSLGSSMCRFLWLRLFALCGLASLVVSSSDSSMFRFLWLRLFARCFLWLRLFALFRLASLVVSSLGLYLLRFLWLRLCASNRSAWRRQEAAIYSHLCACIRSSAGVGSSSSLRCGILSFITEAIRSTCNAQAHKIVMDKMMSMTFKAEMATEHEVS